ncbi:MAG: nicotinate phosphoribosyltransferase [Flavobacteriales bacterium]
MNDPIFHSILDNDFYKFTMQNCVVKLFPNAHARYGFINRGEHKFPKGFDKVLRAVVDEMKDLQLSNAEKQYLRTTCPYLDPSYLDFLQGYRYDPKEVFIAQKGTELSVAIEGLWYRTILWEVPIMAAICECYYNTLCIERLNDVAVKQIARDKIEYYNRIRVKIAEFGTRRRHSARVHSLVTATLKKYGGEAYTGTSNVHLANRFQLKPIGTHAHEWFMFHGAKYGFKVANAMALQHWVNVYRGDLGIALSDTFTTKFFFERFDKMFAKLFDGVRHDSGDPLGFADKTIAHYNRLGIDAREKTIIFSDGLNPEKVAKIAEYCRGRIKISFGIGTDFTNDVGVAQLNIVIKMVEAMPAGEQWTPVVKISDESSKHTGDPDMIRLAKAFLHIG